MSSIDIERFYKSFPTLSHNRNRFPFEKEINFNMKMGEITPIAIIPVVPGQTYNLDLSTVLKVAPLQTPPMDNAVFKAFAFYNPNRNTWKNYKYWAGEKQNPEDPENEPTYLVPKVIAPESGWKFNGFYDNIGRVPGIKANKIDAYIPRTDRQIYNYYFRNQSLENPLKVSLDDGDQTFEEGSTTVAYNDDLRKICKPRDLFTQCLPTQSGTTPVEIPLGSTAPVIGNGMTVGITGSNNKNYGLIEKAADGGNLQYVRAYEGVYGKKLTDSLNQGNIAPNNTFFGITKDPNNSGLIADLTKAMGAPLSGLYQAIAYNTMQYMTSRGGGRYFEILSNIYGVANPDGVLQQPEFLGSTSQVIEFDTVTQTSEGTVGQTGVGHRAANGYMENYNSIINKSFGEFGWIIIYGVVTVYPKYQQGQTKLADTNDPLELFNPIFNLMGDEAIYNGEIYYQGNAVKDENGNIIDDLVFGYGKRNSRLLYPVNEVHGEQRSQYPQSLDTNHFAQKFNKLPKLNKEFDKVTDEAFKRCLQIQDETQFIGNALITGIQDIEIPINAIPMPVPNIKYQI